MGELKYEEFLKSGEFDPAVMTEVERARVLSFFKSGSKVRATSGETLQCQTCMGNIPKLKRTMIKLIAPRIFFD